MVKRYAAPKIGLVSSKLTPSNGKEKRSTEIIEGQGVSVLIVVFTIASCKSEFTGTASSQNVLFVESYTRHFKCKKKFHGYVEFYVNNFHFHRDWKIQAKCMI